jgi:hypothetical protein
MHERGKDRGGAPDWLGVGLEWRTELRGDHEL